METPKSGELRKCRMFRGFPDTATRDYLIAETANIGRTPFQKTLSRSFSRGTSTQPDACDHIPLGEMDRKARA